MANRVGYYSLYALAYATRSAHNYNDFSDTLASSLGCIDGLKGAEMLMPSQLAAKMREMGADLTDGEARSRELEQAKEALEQARAAMERCDEREREVRAILEADPHESTAAAARRIVAAVPDCGPTDRDRREAAAARERLQRLIIAGGETSTGGRSLYDSAGDEIVRLRLALSRAEHEVKFPKAALPLSPGGDAAAKARAAAKISAEDSLIPGDPTSAPWRTAGPSGGLTDGERAALRRRGWIEQGADGRWLPPVEEKNCARAWLESRPADLADLRAAAGVVGDLSAEDAETLRGAGFVETKPGTWTLPEGMTGRQALRWWAAGIRAEKAPAAAHGAPGRVSGAEVTAAGETSVAEETPRAQGLPKPARVALDQRWRNRGRVCDLVVFGTYSDDRVAMSATNGHTFRVESTQREMLTSDDWIFLGPAPAPQDPKRDGEAEAIATPCADTECFSCPGDRAWGASAASAAENLSEPTARDAAAGMLLRYGYVDLARDVADGSVTPGEVARRIRTYPAGSAACLAALEALARGDLRGARDHQDLLAAIERLQDSRDAERATVRGAVTRLGAPDHEGLWPAAERVVRERDEARAEAAAAREELCRARAAAGSDSSEAETSKPWRWLEHEVQEHGWVDDTWIVEGIDHGSEGEIYAAHFSGPAAEERAREYAALMAGTPKKNSPRGQQAPGAASASPERADLDGEQCRASGPVRQEAPAARPHEIESRSVATRNWINATARAAKSAEPQEGAPGSETVFDVNKRVRLTFPRKAESRAVLATVAELLGLDAGTKPESEPDLERLMSEGSPEEIEGAAMRLVLARKVGAGWIRGFAAGIREGERRAKAKAAELVTKWWRKHGAAEGMKKACADDPAGAREWGERILTIDMCEMDVRKAFDLGAPDGQPPTGGEPAPVDDGAAPKADPMGAALGKLRDVVAEIGGLVREVVPADAVAAPRADFGPVEAYGLMTRWGDWCSAHPGHPEHLGISRAIRELRQAAGINVASMAFEIAGRVEPAPETHEVDLGCARPVHAGPEASCRLCRPGRSEASEAPADADERWQPGAVWEHHPDLFKLPARHTLRWVSSDCSYACMAPGPNGRDTFLPRTAEMTPENGWRYVGPAGGPVPTWSSEPQWSEEERDVLWAGEPDHGPYLSMEERAEIDARSSEARREEEPSAEVVVGPLRHEQGKWRIEIADAVDWIPLEPQDTESDAVDLRRDAVRLISRLLGQSTVPGTIERAHADGVVEGLRAAAERIRGVAAYAVSGKAYGRSPEVNREIAAELTVVADGIARDVYLASAPAAPASPVDRAALLALAEGWEAEAKRLRVGAAPGADGLGDWGKGDGLASAAADIRRLLDAPRGPGGGEREPIAPSSPTSDVGGAAVAAADYIGKDPPADASAHARDAAHIRAALEREADAFDASKDEASRADGRALRRAAAIVESERDARLVLAVLGFEPMARNRVLGTSTDAAQDGSSAAHELEAERDRWRVDYGRVAADKIELRRTLDMLAEVAQGIGSLDVDTTDPRAAAVLERFASDRQRLEEAWAGARAEVAAAVEEHRRSVREAMRRLVDAWDRKRGDADKEARDSASTARRIARERFHVLGGCISDFCSLAGIDPPPSTPGPEAQDGSRVDQTTPGKDALNAFAASAVSAAKERGIISNDQLHEIVNIHHRRLWPERYGVDRGPFCSPADPAKAETIPPSAPPVDVAELQDRVSELRRKVASYDGGDRAPSPPARLLRQLHEAEDALRTTRAKAPSAPASCDTCEGSGQVNNEDYTAPHDCPTCSAPSSPTPHEVGTGPTPLARAVEALRRAFWTDTACRLERGELEPAQAIEKVRDWIRTGDPDASDREAIAALKVLCAAPAEEPTAARKDWNRCPRCKNLVDADDVHDGSEVRCHGCKLTLVCTSMTDGTWALVEAEEEPPSDPLDPATPEDEVARQARELGLDPDALIARGADVARAAKAAADDPLDPYRAKASPEQRAVCPNPDCIHDAWTMRPRLTCACGAELAPLGVVGAAPPPKPERVEPGQVWRCVGVEGELVVSEVRLTLAPFAADIGLRPIVATGPATVRARDRDMLGLPQWTFVRRST